MPSNLSFISHLSVLHVLQTLQSPSDLGECLFGRVCVQIITCFPGVRLCVYEGLSEFVSLGKRDSHHFFY